MVGNLNSIYNRNAVLLDTTGETYKNKSIFQKAISLYKGEANSLLTKNEADGDFSFIHKKNEIIKNNINNILYKLIQYGTINKKELDYNLLNYYFIQGYISIQDLKNSIINSLRSELDYILIKANTPITAGGLGGETIIIQDYHDLDHDLLEKEKLILVYGIKNTFLSKTQINILENISKKGGDTLEEFCDEYYDENLLNKYIENLGINI